VGALEFLGQRLELSFGFQRGVGPVGLPHPVADRGGEVIWQPVGDVAQLVQVMPRSA